MTFSRRDFLLGSLGAAAVLSLPRMKKGRAAVGGPARNVIVLLAAGGWDVTYALDPKPGLTTIDAPVGTTTSYGDLDIFTDASRPAVGTYFSTYASITAVIRGVYIRSIAHPECRKRILTGGPTAASPDVAAICAHETGRDRPLPYLVLGDEAFSGPLAASTGRVGDSNQIVALLDPAQRFPAPAGSPQLGTNFMPDADDVSAIQAYVRAGVDRERAVRGAAGANKRALDDFVSSMDRSEQLKAYASGFGNRGRNLALAGQATLAVDALQQGISRSVMMDTRIGWDTHQTNENQSGFHNTLFTALKTLLDDLAARDGSTTGSKMLDETVVLVVSEMSRTPKLNARGGKDHWPVTSAMVIGAGVAGGRAYGGTTNTLESRPVDYETGEYDAAGNTIQTNNLVAGVCELAGVDPSGWFPGVAPLRGFIA
jgi:hypothetical protein